MQGDSVHFAFAEARDGVVAAAAAQRELARHAWGSERIRVRIGLHTGRPVVAETLYTRLVVHRAARVKSVATAVRSSCRSRRSDSSKGSLPPEVGLRDLAEHRLKTSTCRSGSSRWS